MGHRISKEFLHPNVKDDVNKLVGDLSKLETNDKSSIVAAFNEIFVLENGKKIIADAIGNPITEYNSYSEIGNQINELTQKFIKTLNSYDINDIDNYKLFSLVEEIKNIKKYNIPSMAGVTNPLITVLPSISELYMACSSGSFVFDGNHIYLFGGTLVNQTTTDSSPNYYIYKFNTSSGDVQKLPVNISGSKAAWGPMTECGDYLYILNATGQSSSNKIYKVRKTTGDIVLNNITLPVSFGSQSSVQLNSQWFIMGGGYTNALVSFDMLTDTSTTVTNNIGRTIYSASAIVDEYNSNIIYLVGGTSNGSAYLNSIYKFDRNIGAGTEQLKATLPEKPFAYQKDEHTISAVDTTHKKMNDCDIRTNTTTTRSVSSIFTAPIHTNTWCINKGYFIYSGKYSMNFMTSDYKLL